MPLLTHSARYLERALNNLLKYLPAHYSLVVSQDSDDAKVAEVLARPQYRQRLLHIQHTTTRVDWREKGKGSLSSYYFISSHYRFGLRYVVWFMRTPFDISTERSVALCSLAA